ncbi:hypothetical protein FBEOM_8913 [Fusarium beomiforme]|uniref:Uncharacterized protein n=1 Tax=Fusarium beomiforme TaxID=44412 RepID=A0A9P5DWD1_9HYPO|nr:hypothetical protein FBEOM_8913 [Fusarium beomiforme]
MAAAAVQTYTPAAYDHRAVDAMTDVDVAAQRLQKLNGLGHMKSCISHYLAGLWRNIIFDLCWQIDPRKGFQRR